MSLLTFEINCVQSDTLMLSQALSYFKKCTFAVFTPKVDIKSKSTFVKAMKPVLGNGATKGIYKNSQILLAIIKLHPNVLDEFICFRTM